MSQRGAPAEDPGWGVSWEAHRLLLVYTRCLGSAAREGGVASWAWGAAGSTPPRGLFAPRVRWGGSGWTDASGLGEGCRLEMSLESPPGGRGKARRGQVGPSLPHARDGGLLEATQSWKYWPSGAQLHSRVPL